MQNSSTCTKRNLPATVNIVNLVASRCVQLNRGKKAKFSVKHNIYFIDIQATCFGLSN